MANKKRTIATCFSNSADRKPVVGQLSGLGHNLVEFQEETGIQADLFILDLPSARHIGQKVLTLKKSADVFLPMMIALGKHDHLDPWFEAGFETVCRSLSLKRNSRSRWLGTYVMSRY